MKSIHITVNINGTVNMEIRVSVMNEKKLVTQFTYCSYVLLKFFEKYYQS